MIVTSCGNSVNLAKKIAKKLKVRFSKLTFSKFPDGDIYLKYNTEVKGKIIVIVNSFQPNSNKSLFKLHADGIFIINKYFPTSRVQQT